MNMQIKWLTVLGALAAGTLAANATLKIGDPAPKLQTGDWVQGEPVKEFQKDKAYIVEFWATWCGPCKQSIPHLNETYMKYKDKGLVVIGQDCWERDDKLVAPFVEKMGDKMTYRVALDDKSENKKGAMAVNWMEAAGQNGIPTAFIVDKQGVIAWIGHPMSMKESVLDQVLAGTYDVHKAAVQYEKEQKAMAQLQEFNTLVGKGDYTAAYKVVEEASDANKDNAGLQNELAWAMLMDKRIKQRDLALAGKIAMRANDAAEGKDANIIDTLARARFMQGKKDEAIALQEKAINMAESDEQKALLKKSLEEYKNGELTSK